MQRPVDPLVAKLRAQREICVDLGLGRSVRLIRPPEAEFATFSNQTGLQLATTYAVGWDGFTEDFLLGAAIGAADEPVAFTADRWAEVVGDRADWIAKCVEALAEAINAHIESRGLLAKN